MSFDHAAYSSIVFIDSMVALEGKPLPDLPWSDIDRNGPILVLITPQVASEVDKRKRDGRLQKVARAFNRLLMPAAESGRPVRIAEGPPAVDIGLARIARIDWSAFDDLDPEGGDARVIAQILHARDVPQVRKLFISQDVNPIGMASRQGLMRMKLTESWLRDPEPSPADKEMARLKARVKQLETTEPDLRAEMSFEAPDPLVLYRVRPLDEAEKQRLVEEMTQANPRNAQFRDQIGVTVAGFDHGYDRKYEAYLAKLPDFAERLPGHLETQFGQILFRLSIENQGSLQAENLIIELNALSGRLHNRFVHGPIFGPVAPRPEPFRSQIPRLSPFHELVPRQPGRHEISFAVKPGSGSRIEAHCHDFRHGRIWEFEGVATLSPAAASPFVIEVEMTAANLKGFVEARYEIPFRVEEVTVYELIDFARRKRLRPIPLQQRLDAALRAQDLSWFAPADDRD